MSCPNKNKMKVILAGYNLDSEVIESLKRGEKLQDNVTPEVLSASYARISRDPRPINELREISRQEVGKARKSNQNIIFKMGHHSVAEHAVFNFDIIDVSRFAMEEIEKFRLCAYTEKSQRYQKLEDNYVTPEEIKDPLFKQTIELQNLTYQKMIEKGVEPEDARYITALATKGQLGLTVNARNLELMFRRFASSKYAEVRELGREMYKQVEKIAPSIILFTSPNALDRDTYREIEGIGMGKDKDKEKNERKQGEVALVGYTPDADEMTIAALLHSTSNLPFRECREMAGKMREEQGKELIKTALKNMEFYDTTLREFEYADLTFEIVLSAACFGQLKRHRMATLTCQEYNPNLGITIPPKIKEAGMELAFTEVVEETEKAYRKLKNPYVLTNAHRKRVLFKCNARELYHISRLREDAHAQWDIQNISREMTELARKAMPLTMLTICGKDRYPEVYEKVFGRPPKIKAEF